MKKILVVLCCLFALAGCGKTNKGNATASSNERAASNDKNVTKPKDSKSVNQNNDNNKTPTPKATPGVNKENQPTNQKTSTEANKENQPSSCSINTPEKAIQAVEKYTKVKASKDISYNAQKLKGNYYNVFASSADMKKKGGSGTVGNYMVDACSGNIWNVAVLIPDEMVGTWNADENRNKNSQYILTKTTVTTGGKTFVLDTCEPDNSNKNTTYTISWNVNAFKKQYGYLPVGPQPFMLTYNEQNDTITVLGGPVLKRVSK